MAPAHAALLAAALAALPAPPERVEAMEWLTGARAVETIGLSLSGLTGGSCDASGESGTTVALALLAGFRLPRDR